MASKLNSIFVSLFNLILLPVNSFSDEVKIIYISVLSGIIFLLIYGKVSNQKGLKEVKRKITARVLEVALFRHSIKVCLRSQVNLFKQGFKYLSFALIPLLILMVPCILIMAELNYHFQSKGLSKNDEAIIEVAFNEPMDLADYKLSSEEGKLSPALRVDDEAKIFWKYKNDGVVNSNGSKDIITKLSFNDLSLDIPVRLGTSSPSLLTYSKNFFESLLFPSKYQFNNAFSEIKSITVRYPDATQSYFGMEINWLWVFLIVSILSGLVASKVFKIEI